MAISLSQKTLTAPRKRLSIKKTFIGIEQMTSEYIFKREANTYKLIQPNVCPFYNANLLLAMTVARSQSSGRSIILMSISLPQKTLTAPRKRLSIKQTFFFRTNDFRTHIHNKRQMTLERIFKTNGKHLQTNLTRSFSILPFSFVVCLRIYRTNKLASLWHKCHQVHI